MDYFNDPELNGKYLGTITKDFATVSDTLKEASYQIRKREISQHPVFIFARQAVQLGSLLINADEQDTNTGYCEISRLRIWYDASLMVSDAVAKSLVIVPRYLPFSSGSLK